MIYSAGFVWFSMRGGAFLPQVYYPNKVTFDEDGRDSETSDEKMHLT